MNRTDDLSDLPDLPVLVVGAGPVGLATAFFLACHGVRPLVIEQRDTTGAHPRANTSPRTLELFRATGLGPQLARLGWQSDNPYAFVFKERGIGPVLERTRHPEHVLDRLLTCTPVPRLILTSDGLERLLLEQIRARGGEVRFGTRLESVTDWDGDRVRATFADLSAGPGRRTRVAARYVVAADGARSGVRAQLGVTMPDVETAGTVNTVMFRADVPGLRGDPAPGGETAERARFVFVRNSEVFAAIGSANGDDLWGAHLMDYPGKPPVPRELSDEHATALLHAAIGAPVPLEILSSRVWNAPLGLAAAFRRGRVFLAGDAAHVQTSAGGLGMNTGIQDAHNLAWKLAAVLQEAATPALLDSYEAERRPAAALSVAYSRLMTRDVGIGPDAERQGAPDALREHPATAHLRAMMCYEYDSTAIVADEKSHEAADVFRDEVRPGLRLPHRWLRLAGTRTRVSTVDLAGPEWLLLTGPYGRAWQHAAGAASAARTAGVPLRTHRIVPFSAEREGSSPLDDGAERGVPDHTGTCSPDLGDADGAFHALTGAGAEGAVLVRPDGFVCWRTTEPGTSRRLRAVLDRILRP